MTEPIIDPDLPIIDAHHHLWDVRALAKMLATDDTHGFSETLRLNQVYLFEHLLSDATTGHNLIGTVLVESHSFYREDGPESMKSVGEVEHANGVAARAASGLYGKFRACAGIVGHVDLSLGDQVAPVLEASISAGNGRLSGVRHMGASDSDETVLGPISLVAPTPLRLFYSDQFRDGFTHLGRHGLSFDAWVFEPQIDDVADLAAAFPDTAIVLNHVGTPLGIGSYARSRDERFPIWRKAIRRLADHPNVMVKLGGLGMAFPGFEIIGPTVRPSSERLAALWAPYIETCIEAFGPSRAMFESNFPVDSWGADYATIWNAFKRIARGASTDEKRELFAGTAKRFYRLPITIDEAGL